MNKEVQDALHTLLNMALENDKYESQREQFNIVNDYITNLEQRIDKAIQELKKYIPDDDDTILFTNNQRRKIMYILQGSDINDR